MGALVPYAFEGRTLRSLDRNGDPWFIAGDVASFLGYRDAEKLTRSLDPDEKGTQTVGTPGGAQDVSVISEAGLYRAIAQRREVSTLPAEAREFIARFQRWLFHDVLPKIRRTGSYAMPTTPPVETSAREIRLMHKHALSIAKAAGLAGNQLLIAANRVTKRGTGFDVLAEMGITHLVAPVNDPLVIPTKLGQDLGGLTPREINKLLARLGYQWADKDHRDRNLWRPTPKGEALGAQLMDRERSNDTGAAQQLMWPLAATLEVLRAGLRDDAGDDGEAA